MTGLICGLYRYDDAAKLLTEPPSGQSLRLVHKTDAGGLWFEYSDKETSLELVVEKTICSWDDGRYVDVVFLLDWDGQKDKQVSQNYGLWRRLTFFALNSLPVWFYLTEPKNHQFGRVELRGCWVNAKWDPTATVCAVKGRGLKDTDLNKPPANNGCRPGELGLVPIPWDYHDNRNPKLDFSLQLDSSASLDVSILARSPSILDQLQAVPYFYRADEKAFLFHRVVRSDFHRQEYYSPIPFYGYVNECCAFGITAHYSYKIRSFGRLALTAADVSFDNCFREIANIGGNRHLTLSFALAEEFTSALIDIAGLMRERSWFRSDARQAPVIPEIDLEKSEARFERFKIRRPRERGVYFGSYLDEMEGQLTQISFRGQYGRDVPWRGLTKENNNSDGSVIRVESAGYKKPTP